jgi:hypothetical protein
MKSSSDGREATDVDEEKNEETTSYDSAIVETEEYWPTIHSLRTKHQLHVLSFGQHEDDGPRKRLLYKSISGEDMTPLDVTYYHHTDGRNSNDEHNNNNNNKDDVDEFYDGTGNLMWMAAVCSYYC